MDDIRIDAIVPLTVLDAVKRLDKREPEGLEDYRKLGASATVSAQIERYRKLALIGGVVAGGEVSQLFRLVGRRPDASLVFSQAGRSAGREALRRVPRFVRIVRGVSTRGIRRRLDLAASSRLAERVFDMTVSRDPERGIVATAGSAHEVLGSFGVACDFYGSALAEMIRALSEFDGAVIHGTCRARGDGVCSWHTGNKLGW